MGKKFKEIRKGKRLTQQEISDEYIGTSTISRFEKGEQDISISAAIHLLDEFYHHMEDVPMSIEEEIGELNRAYLEEKINKLEKLTEKYYLKRYESVRFLHYSILCKAYLSNIRNESINDYDSNIITSYLYNIDEWHYYEVTLFNNIHHLFTVETVDSLAKIAIKKLKVMNL